MKTIKHPFFLVGSAFVLMCFVSVQAFAKCPESIPLNVLEKILGSKMEDDKVKPITHGRDVYTLKAAPLAFESLRVKLSAKTALSTEFPTYASLGAANQTKTVLDPFTLGTDVKVEMSENMGEDLCGYKITREEKSIYKGNDLVVFEITPRPLLQPPSLASRL